MIYCSKCGTESGDEELFCRKCGTSLISADVADAITQDLSDEIEALEKKQEKKEWCVVIIGWLIFAAILYLFITGFREVDNEMDFFGQDVGGLCVIIIIGYVLGSLPSGLLATWKKFKLLAFLFPIGTMIYIAMAYFSGLVMFMVYTIKRVSSWFIKKKENVKKL